MFTKTHSDSKCEFPIPAPLRLESLSTILENVGKWQQKIALRQGDGQKDGRRTTLSRESTLWTSSHVRIVSVDCHSRARARLIITQPIVHPHRPQQRRGCRG